MDEMKITKAVMEAGELADQGQWSEAADVIRRTLYGLSYNNDKEVYEALMDLERTYRQNAPEDKERQERERERERKRKEEQEAQREYEAKLRERAKYRASLGLDQPFGDPSRNEPQWGSRAWEQKYGKTGD